MTFEVIDAIFASASVEAGREGTVVFVLLTSLAAVAGPADATVSIEFIDATTTCKTNKRVSQMYIRMM